MRACSIGHALHLDRTRLIVQSDRFLEAREIAMISALAARRLRHEPVSRILGQKEFWSLIARNRPGRARYRGRRQKPSSKLRSIIVVRGGLRMEKLRILDIGTGSGALLLALLHELPNATGTGTDVSAAALQAARTNAAQFDFEARCTFVVCDIAVGPSGPIRSGRVKSALYRA